MRNPVLFTEQGVNENLSSLYHKNNCTVIKILDTGIYCVRNGTRKSPEQQSS